MSSVLLLALAACLLAVPGVAGCILVFGEREGSVVTRLAVVFGLGYAVTGGCAFALAAMHFFTLAVFLPVWLVVSAGLWVAAARLGWIQGFWRVLVSDVGTNQVVLGLGALVLIIFMAMHLRYLFVVGGPRYVYYLNGLEIANSHGVPSQTLEYGQSWPPATDKIFLDAFTALLVLINHNAAVGPGVLLLLSTAGAFLGLWATAWELGMRRAAILLPLLYMGNLLFLSKRMSEAFTEYRAEDFGRAVAFCALAAGIAAVREKDKARAWRLAGAGGLILAAASGTHLIPVVVVVLVLCLVGLAELLFNQQGRERLIPVQRLLALGGLAGVTGAVIRLFAGGAFGLQGAQSPSSYKQVHDGTATFDPTAYLYGGTNVAEHPRTWGTQPAKVIQLMVTQRTAPPKIEIALMLIVPILLALLLLLNESMRPVAVIGLGIMGGLTFVALAFDLVYHTYIDETFGIRRLSTYVPLGFMLLVLAVGEYLFEVLDRDLPRVAAIAAVAGVMAVCAWLLPSTEASRQENFVGAERTDLVNWVRTQTPCNARFLINQRTEGTFTALTGRFALLEGMGAFLRTQQMPYVVSLMLRAQHFFKDPLADDQFLLNNNISYVVVAQGFQELGYAAPIGPPNVRQLATAPFLQLVYTSRSISVYRVVGSGTSPVSPLLNGPLLHCVRAPVSF